MRRTATNYDAVKRQIPCNYDTIDRPLYWDILLGNITTVRVLKGVVAEMSSVYGLFVQMPGCERLEFLCYFCPAVPLPNFPDVCWKTHFRPTHRPDPPGAISPLCATLPRRL